MRNFRFNFLGIIKLKPVWHVEGVWALGVGENELTQGGKAELLCFGRAASFWATCLHTEQRGGDEEQH